MRRTYYGILASDIGSRAPGKTAAHDLTATGAHHAMSAAPLIRPDDVFNRRLVGHVHPPAWTNPAPPKRYDLVVLGGGTAGLVSAAIASSLGARVALIERHLLGGDCLNIGCVPSKAILEAARAWHAAGAAAERFGGPRAVAGSGDFAAVMERMRRIRAEIGSHDAAARFQEEYAVDVHLGGGRFTGEDTVQVEEVALRFRRAIIATGARASAPPIPGLEEAGYLTNASIFELTELPSRLGIIGGGPIGCEMAQAFARFGSVVTILDQADRILLHDDEEAAQVVLDALRGEGVSFRGGVEIGRVEASGRARTIHFTHGGAQEALEVDQLLVAAGRQPNLEGLGLEAAGVRADPRRGVQVNRRLQTSNRRIFAVGDVVPGLQFTHRSDHHARVAVPNALFFTRSSPREGLIPWCTYTSPELAHVGLTAEQAGRRGAEVESVTIPFAEVDRSRLASSEQGFLRVHLERGRDTILGATIVGEHAGELISQMAAAMTAGLGLSKLGETIFPYPTRAEVIRRAADARRREKLTPALRRALGVFWRLRR
jgi:pyruvate/2-oxoglutarate dehydrogenase complex dihydrolipoamide dehydrogenase (E3) component